MKNLKTYLLIGCVLLLVAVAPMPYGYYQILRIAITLVASINAFELYNKSVLFVVFVSIIILYNPIIPIHLSKESWMPLNLLTAVFMGVFALVHKNKEVGSDGV